MFETAAVQKRTLISLQNVATAILMVWFIYVQCIYKVGNFIWYNVQLLCESQFNFSIIGSSAVEDSSSGHMHSEKLYTSVILGTSRTRQLSLFTACFGSNSKLGTKAVFKTTHTYTGNHK